MIRGLQYALLCGALGYLMGQLNVTTNKLRDMNSKIERTQKDVREMKDALNLVIQVPQ